MSELGSLCEQVSQCTRCRLSQGRTHAVPGAGSETADLMFIGEAPGFHEDQQGLPFVGAAGQLLDQLLASINMTRSQVYIANVIKCRPPNNRDPQPDEMDACRPYLDRQIELIKPKVIATLGRFSLQLAFSNVTISRVHGVPKKVGDIIYYPLFHPAAALRQMRYRTLLEQDFARIPEMLAGLQSVSQEDEPLAPQQLSLF